MIELKTPPLNEKQEAYSKGMEFGIKVGKEFGIDALTQKIREYEIEHHTMPNYQQILGMADGLKREKVNE